MLEMNRQQKQNGPAWPVPLRELQMIIKPMIRNNICINSHPAGCVLSVQHQIDYAKKNIKPACSAVPRLVLVIGCSGGYGLASRIAAAFGYGAVTVGLSREKAGTKTQTGTPGFYHNLSFDREAAKISLVSKTLDGDAYTSETKAQAVEAVREAAIKAKIPAKIDLIVYSLASPARTDPKTGILHKAVIKPIGIPFSGQTLNMMDGSFLSVHAEPATEEEVFNTVKVMGGEDWELWIETLEKEGLLTSVTRTIAYSYLGPEISWPIYKNGTIGKAKEDLERACRSINKTYNTAGNIAGAWISVNKALVTRASAVIPIFPLYVSCLFKVMKEMNLHENCIEQIVRLYNDKLYTSKDPQNIPVDSEGRIRIDDWEMREDVQRAVMEKMNNITQENVYTETDLAGFKYDFLKAHGFDVAGIDYDADLDPGDYIGIAD